MGRRLRFGRTRLAVAAVGGALLLGGLGFRFAPAVALALALAAPATESWLRVFLQEPVREEIAVDVGGRMLDADLYRPPRPRGALLLVHGLSPASRRHPDLMRLARLLAQHGQLVLVPHFQGLAMFRLSGREVEEIRSTVDHLRGMGSPPGLAGFSFGAGPALLAAAGVPGLRLCASFGGYARLEHVIAFITTGAHSFGGRRYVQPQEEYNRWKLLALLAGFVEDPRDRDLLDAVARRRLEDPSRDTGRLESALGQEGRAVLAVVLNRREDALADLLARLPARARQALESLSPLAAVSKCTGRVLIAHGAEDPSIPFTESLRLAEAAGGRARVVILESFHHTGPETLWRSVGRSALDAWRVFRLADDLLATA